MYKIHIILALCVFLTIGAFAQDSANLENSSSDLNQLALQDGFGINDEFWKIDKDSLSKNEQKALGQQFMIVMFGNSLTENGKWAEGLGRDDVKNSGTGGFTTSHFVWIIGDKVLKYKPKICFLEGGINDIGVGIPLERIYKNYESLVDTLLSHKIIPVLQSTLFVNFPNNEAENMHHNPMVESLNTFLKKLAESRKVDYLDLNQYFSEDNKLKKELTIDGVHVNDAAYKIWYTELEKVLRRKGI